MNIKNLLIDNDSGASGGNHTLTSLCDRSPAMAAFEAFFAGIVHAVRDEDADLGDAERKVREYKGG